MAIMNKLQAAYLAGLIDGEGYVGIIKVRKGTAKEWNSLRDCYYIPAVKVVMTHRGVVEWLYKSYGGTFAKRKPRNERCKPTYEWMLRKRQVEHVLRKVRPYLRVKKGAANIVLEFIGTISKDYCFKGVPDSVFQKREALYQEIRGEFSKTHPVRKGAAVETEREDIP